MVTGSPARSIESVSACIWIDFNGALKEYAELKPGEYSKGYFGLWFGLEELFSRKVDLVVGRAIKNPYFLRTVNMSRTVIYAG